MEEILQPLSRFFADFQNKNVGAIINRPAAACCEFAEGSANSQSFPPGGQ